MRLPQLLESILEEAQSLLNADRGGGVYLYEPDQQMLRLAHGTGMTRGAQGLLCGSAKALPAMSFKQPKR